MIKIITWNVNRNHVFIEDTLCKLANIGANILCLQEVAPTELAKIKKIFANYDCFHAREELSRFGKTKNYFLITLIEKSFAEKHWHHQAIPLKCIRAPIYKITQSHIDIEYLQNIFLYQDRKITLINCHLQYAAAPHIRVQQLRQIINTIDTDYFIIAGDLNTFSRPFFAFFLYFLFGYHKDDFFIYEAENITKTVPNIHSGNPNLETTIYKTGKLDWILFSSHFAYIQENILKPLRGTSDHFPILAQAILKN